MPPSYPLDGSALAVGSEVWADTIPVIDQSALDAQNSLTCQKEMTVKEVMIQAYGGLYDAANSQALTTSFAALEGTAWNGSLGPTAYNTTLTATSNDGITPTIGGIYEIFFRADWSAAAAHTVTFAVYAAAAAITGFQAAPASVTETASQAQAVTIHGYAALTAAEEVRIFVKANSGTPTLTLANVMFWIKRVGPSA